MLRRTLAPIVVLTAALVTGAAGQLQTPEQFLGFKVGTDNKLARWDKIVEYMKRMPSLRLNKDRSGRATCWF